jgi:hypothetical protein
MLGMRNMARGIPRFTGVQRAGRLQRFSDKPASPMEEFRGREKGNYVIAGALLAFVGGIYYTAISKMKQQDDLAEALEDDAMSVAEKTGRS